ncbi:MAG: hypothetical protein ACOY3P_24260 [Planctomycetota bacterium]
MLRFDLSLPTPGAIDVVTREIAVKIDDNDEDIRQLGGGEVVSAGYAGNDGAVVQARLVDVDDAGNRSEPREQTWTLVDTLPPPQPGEMGIVITGED